MEFGNGVADLQQKLRDGLVARREVTRFQQLHREIGRAICLAVGVEARKGSGFQG